jgi:hypothetical protein
MWRSGLVQAIAVIAVSLLLALLLPRSFFESWGWVSGPIAWGLCALLTARLLGLPAGVTLLGAALAGIPSFAAVLLGIHWLGVLLAVLLFAAWCGAVAARSAGASAA